VEAAGIQLPQPAIEWSWPADRLKQGVDLSSGRIRRSHPGLFQVARKKLGSWQKALESVGLDYESIRRSHDWTPQAVIDRLRQLHEAGEDTPRSSLPQRALANHRTVPFPRWLLSPTLSVMRSNECQHRKSARGGVRAMSPLLITADGQLFTEVQPERYRYAAIADGGVLVRIVIDEYLAAEVWWDESA
jgi:hypothetical protein